MVESIKITAVEHAHIAILYNVRLQQWRRHA